jgi:uncharacterized membrane protein YdjX (TVP38/TMEM64 family)
MRDLLRPMLPMIVILAIPIVPFLLLGRRTEAWLAAWKQDPPPAPAVATGVIVLLATDVLLPVPSSVVATLAGYQLGAVLGTLASWAGLSLGAAGGFALARWLGPPFVRWFTRPDDLAKAARLAEKYGPLLLVLARGVPVLAEASVLLLGMHRLSWGRFLPPVLLSNLGLALAYAVFGEVAEKNGLLPLALGVSIALPVLLAAAFRAWQGGKPQR